MYSKHISCKTKCILEALFCHLGSLGDWFISKECYRFKNGLNIELPYIKTWNPCSQRLLCVCVCKQSLGHLKIAQRPRSRLVAFVTIFEVRQIVHLERIKMVDSWCKMKILWSWYQTPKLVNVYIKSNIWMKRQKVKQFSTFSKCIRDIVLVLKPNSWLFSPYISPQNSGITYTPAEKLKGPDGPRVSFLVWIENTVLDSLMEANYILL